MLSESPTKGVKMRAKDRFVTIICAFCMALVLAYFMHSPSGLAGLWHASGPSGDHIPNPMSGKGIWDSQGIDDRVLDQMNFVPDAALRTQDRPKVIMTYPPRGTGKGLPEGTDLFKQNNCPVSNCALYDDAAFKDYTKADVLVIESPISRFTVKPLGQLWLLYLKRNPTDTPPFSEHMKDKFNWTATYRTDSTIPIPHLKWVPSNAGQSYKIKQGINYAAGKTKKVAWIPSQCSTTNDRHHYVDKLSQYIDVDIYGRCGTLQCPSRDKSNCYEFLRSDYKFFLAFEPANCKGYISDVFFEDALGNDILPIVMGARPQDYEKAAPPHSFIHVDQFASPKDLADYLHRLDNDDALYNEYFAWKGTGELVKSQFWCRLCAMIHDENKPSLWVPDIEGWWKEPGVCAVGRWNQDTSERHDVSNTNDFLFAKKEYFHPVETERRPRAQLRRQVPISDKNLMKPPPKPDL